MDFLDSLDDEDTGGDPPHTAPTAPSFADAFQFTYTSDMGFDDHPIEIVEDDGTEYAQLDLGPDKVKLLKSVTFLLILCDDGGTPLVRIYNFILTRYVVFSYI